METVDNLIEPLRHSPQLPQAVRLLTKQLESERQARERFYREMTPDQKIEFIDGRIILRPPARNRELDVMLSIATLLSTSVGLQKLGTVKSAKCLCVFPRNDYEPDVVFFGKQKAATLEPNTMKFPVPDLVVEVLSDSTEERDRGVKFEDFAVNGVGEYWIVDADTAQMEQYVLDAGAYVLRLKSSSGRVRSEVVAGFEIDIEALFDEPKTLRGLQAIMAAK
ncbi:MAG: Uma2 family endonuclease [Planctomycetes bacterium]|nr:Uma2 family endonuclease [Planctomycetota bacterium]